MSTLTENPTIGIVIPAAGRGTRAGEGCQKAYRRIGGDTVLNRVLKLFRSWNTHCPIVIVHHGDDTSLLEASIDRDSNIHTTTEGVERQASVLHGLRFLSSLPKSPSHVFIHDAARPFASHTLLNNVLESLIKEPLTGVIPAIAVSDTLKKTDSNGLIKATVPRDGLFRAQTPQEFTLQTILYLHERAATSASLYTDDASLLEEAGLPVRIVQGDSQNIKLTLRCTAANLLSSMTTDSDVTCGIGADTIIIPSVDDYFNLMNNGNIDFGLVGS
ncbi:hypothetical protein N7536_010574 [Penicillium majusculum]|uniref:2-C-methyl-D-erythritol 4-phosphate cytidylyltransferase n=1 Tax=Penicillium solitum TaxID=60172 RepID=A0A1V6QJQ3_9EURO|nr:uncharacterized protein PENSOL_c066G00789 [Penicillium solitum]KAJ5687955.1 hypothetical protein N7536_010574 [Penicillium majusculum]OQD89212.1 hypothetical protein PENSOL_c066G00789 [Penicillium solitum]